MEKTEIKKPTIQERIASRVNEILDPVEVWLDRYNNNPDRFNPETLKLVPLFKKEKVGGVHARKIQERFEEPYKEFQMDSLQEEVSAALDTLKDREREVVKMYFGIDRESTLTVHEMGEKFNLTSHRIAQIRDKAIRRLRHRSRSVSLRSYV